MSSEKTSVLEGLFDSKIKVKLLKLFLQNEEEQFTLDDITERTQSDSSSVRYQLRKLRSIDFINSSLVRFPSKQEDKDKGRKRRVYFANPEFSLLEELKELVVKPTPINKEEIKEEIEQVGKIKLAVLSGIFVNQKQAKTDLLLVGENIDTDQLDSNLKDIEAQLGRKLRYTTMSEDEFDYRVDMFDNFLKKTLKEPHETIIKEVEIPF